MTSIENLKLVRANGWYFLTRLKKNRQVREIARGDFLANPDDTKNVAVETLDVVDAGQVVHLKEFGFARLFRTVAPNGDGE